MKFKQLWKLTFYIIGLIYVTPISAQTHYTISGPTTVTAGATGVQYTCSPALQNGASWNVQGCTFIGTINTNTTLTLNFKASGCSLVTINIISGGTQVGTLNVTVQPVQPLNGGTISNPNQYLYAGATPSLIQATAGSGGTCMSNSYGYQWHAVTGGIDNTISGATSQNYQPGIISTTTSYYRVTSCAGNNVNTSNTATVYVYPKLVAGTISPASSMVNYNTSSGLLTCTAATGGAGNYTYQWMVSGSSSVLGTGLSFQPTDKVTGTNYYYVVVNSSPASGVNFTTNSNYAIVTAYPQLSPGTISPSTFTICANTDPGPLGGSLPTGGNGTYSYQWYYSTDNGVTWSQATGTNNQQNYRPGNIPVATTYRRDVTSNGFTASSYAQVSVFTSAGANIPATLDIVSRDNTISAYQATQSITFESGFISEDGASFTAQIVSQPCSVPPAANSVGNPNYDMNWTQVRNYDENGNLIGDGKAFFDAIGRPLQSQSKVFYRVNANTVYTHVLASQSIRDAYGRNALTTMAAPIGYSDFSYQAGFAQTNSSGTVYSHQNFDLYNPSGTVGGDNDNTNKPTSIWTDPSFAPPPGTLAWYYSNNNTWEPYAPTTNYPFARQTYYSDGSGSGKKTATVGDAFIMGSGHEICGYVVPVANELDFYVKVRNKFFASAEVGNLPATLQGQAIQKIVHDANGLEAVVIQDRRGNILMTARAGTDQLVNNTVTIGAPHSSDMNIYYFKLLTGGTVGITGGAYTLVDMNTEKPTSLSGTGTLQAGYYKVVNTGTTALTLTYSNGYCDISYNFYNQLGQLVATVAPEGVKKLYGVNQAGLGNYSNKASIPFVSIYNYNERGKLISRQDPDQNPGGIAQQFIYRNDGKIRFSQNAVQALAGSYSYNNYDGLGRPIESGQYLPDPKNGGITWTNVAGIVESVSPGGGLTAGTKTDVNMVLYDVPDNGYGPYVPTSPKVYVQDPFNLGGAVSVTQKYSIIVNNVLDPANLQSATWFNYDDEGKVTWVIKYIKGLGYKTMDHTYDVMGHLIKKVFQAGTPAETFVHYFDFDPINKQLLAVYTNTTDNPARAGQVLQAKYYYYLHGGLKRIELGSNLQGIDYTYTLQGDLKAINNSNRSQDPGNDGKNAFAADAFGEVLDYYAGDYVNGRSGVAAINGVNANSITADSYVGNIKAMTWYTEKPTSTGLTDAPTTYVYQYDPKYQFTESTWGTGLNFGTSPAGFTPSNFNKEKVGNSAGSIAPYDGNGNLQYLSRTDGSGNPTDKFIYNYGSGNNRLTSIAKDTSGQPTFATYGYDLNGQITSETIGDGSTPSKYLVYDVSGKVIAVYQDAGHTQQIAGFVYDESGFRIQKLSYNNTFQLSQVTYYTGDVTYTQRVTGGGNTFENAVVQEYQITGGEGRLGVYYPQGPIYAYELSDHLGNVRAVIAQNGSTCQVRMYSDYYPFGMVINSGGTNDYRNGYQGKYAENDPETGWNKFELRMYESRVARWLQYDPKRTGHSPYIAMNNNPISNTDPDGGCAECRAWDFLAKVGTDKASDPYVNSKGIWIVNYQGTSYEFKPDIEDRMNNFVNFVRNSSNDLYDEAQKYEFTAEVKAKVTVGAQVGFNWGGWGSDKAKVKLEGGVMVLDLAEASAGWSSKKGGSVDYKTAWSDDPDHSIAHKVHNFASIQFGPLSNIGSFTPKVDYVYSWANNSNGLDLYNGHYENDLKISGPKVGPKLNIVGDLVTSQLGFSTTIDGEKVFHGLDLGTSVKVVLGLDVKLKLGFYR